MAKMWRNDEEEEANLWNDSIESGCNDRQCAVIEESEMSWKWAEKRRKWKYVRENEMKRNREARREGRSLEEEIINEEEKRGYLFREKAREMIHENVRGKCHRREEREIKTELK